MNSEDINGWTTPMVEEKMRELEHAYDHLQTEYLNKKQEIINDLTLLRNRLVIDDIIKRLQKL